MKAIKTATNKAGRRFAIVLDLGKHRVMTECKNYAPHVRGGIATTWRLVETCPDLESAEKLLARKAAGKERP